MVTAIIQPVLDSNISNALLLQLQLDTSFALDRWDQYLCDYEDRIIVDYLRFGWSINYQSSILPTSTFKNHPSAVQHHSQLLDYITEELNHKAIIGPFPCNPFTVPCIISPLQTVHKRDSSKLRIVHDLSFPEHSSVNSGIPKDSYLNREFKLLLPGTDRVLEFIRLRGPHCHLYKKDLRRAFRQIPVDPKDIPLLGFSVKNQLFFHTRLPFGLRSATMICQRVTKAVIHIMTQEGYLADVYIDDFYGAETPGVAMEAFNRLTTLLKELGLEASPSKDQPPDTQMLLLGIWFNTDDMTMSVPDFRLDELKCEINHWLQLDQASKHDLQVLVGKLSFVCCCVRPGRAFMASLLNQLRACTARSSTIPVTPDIKQDLSWWLVFLDHYNGTSVIGTVCIESGDSLFATDACLTGCGAICEGEFFHACFPPFILQQDLAITQLELLTIVVAVKLWQCKLRGRCIRIHCDNQACVTMINSMSSKNAFLQSCLQELWLTLALNKIMLCASHIPGHANTLADCLSRWSTNTGCQDQFYDLTSGAFFKEVTVDPELFAFSHI